MHIAFICHCYDSVKTPSDLLDLHFTTTIWAEQLAKTGLKISVLYRFHNTSFLEKNDVHYYFFKDKLPPLLRKYHFAFQFYKWVADFVKTHQVDVLHAHDTLALSSNFLLRRTVPHIPILVQDHTGVSTLRFPLFLRWSLKGMNRVLFAAKGQEDVWLQHKVISKQQCRFVMEVSSTFQYQSRDKARVKTTLSGQPILLWVGNLDANKDPFTVLTAFDLFLQYYPEAQLYMIFRLNPLQTEVETFIQKYPRLKKTVHLLGKKTRNKLVDYYNSADYFIAASHKEGSGYAAIEAISCGLIPILSRIPSFEALTNNGQIGQLFEVGNANILADKLLTAQQHPIEKAQKEILQHFQQQLSFTALAMQMKAIYQEMLH